jgi:DNA-binding GntR family transcriptional regulator
VSGRLAPGARLHDQQLARQMGLSRTPVREALRRLEDEGLITTLPRSRTLVAPVHARAAREAFLVVASLHALATRLALTRWQPTDYDALYDANRALEHALEHGDEEAAIAADDAFHGVFVKRADNRELSRVLNTLMPKVRRLEWLQFHSLRGRQSVAQHAAIIEAVQSDPMAAVRLVEDNWLSLGDLIVKALDEERDHA